MKMRATQNIFYGTKDGDAQIHGGAVLDESDPLVKAFPDLFEPVFETVSNPADQLAPFEGSQPPVRRRRNG